MVGLQAVLLFSVTGLLMNSTTVVGKKHYGGRVLHGTRTEIFSHPYIVLIVIHFPPDKNIKCTGFILAPKIVMTANHCFTSDKGKTFGYSDINVYAGSDDTYNDPPTREIRKGRKVVRSPDYQFQHKDGKTLSKDDVAIIILDEALDYNEEVKNTVISNDEQDQLQKMSEGYECLILGWGISGRLNYIDSKLRGETTYLMTDEECRAKHCEVAGGTAFGRILCRRNFWDEGEICTFSEETTACKGDSGGPLMCDGKVHGVVNYGLAGFENDTCIDAPSPDVYANVRTMLKVWNFLARNKYYVELSRSPNYRKYPNAPERAHPFLVEIRMTGRKNPCAGTIIRPNLILTACHCVTKGDGSVVDPSQVDIIAGAEPYVQTSTTQHIIPHKACARRFLKTGKKGKIIYDNDVAFLILKSKLVLNSETVASIDVGSPKDEKKYTHAERECHVYGFGRQQPSKYGTPPSTEITMDAVFLSPEVPCRKRFCNATSSTDELCSLKHYYSSGLMCGKRDAFSHCFGHTGGPVVCSGAVYGVDSVQLPCRSWNCLDDGECYDEPALFQNTIAIWQVYTFIKNNPPYMELVSGS